MPTPAALPRRRFFAKLGLFASAFVLAPKPRVARAGIDPYLGEIMITPYDFAPRGWAMCNGQLLSIAQNQALFQLLGTTYGGNGFTTFALPNLQGRLALHRGQGPGLTMRTRGESGGELAHTLTLAEMPSHTHVARASSAIGTDPTPSVTVVPARNAAQIPQWAAAADTAMAAEAISPAGASQPHYNLQPYLTFNYCIALVGVYPT